MAKSQGVWGIDIGQCAVKALRCLPGEEPGTIVADAFDYIEYPKILSQPESNPEELIAEALQQFLSRNQVQGDRVAISVAGQNGLARFVKLPPVEVKKIPDLVRYEARNQIPFDLDEVIWDYQQMGGGMIEEGFAIDVEMGLFAMKREQVEKALRPFADAKVEVDVVQLTPLALYNFVVFDQMAESLPDPDFYDPENPPESTMILSLGTETTDLVITDGFRVWQRSLPIGGSHFTKALTKELKQTFAKAEHIKRNAAQAENPKALFQAMRPIFADLVTEVQRSINFFANVHKKATIGSGIALGSTGKLPGLVRFLSQNLKMPITRVDSFRGLRGAGIVDAPAFQENLLAFPVSYGLCLQGLAESAIQTNLIPRELLVDRMVRAKKPWAAGAIAALTVALTVSFVGQWHQTLAVRDDPSKKPSWGTAEAQVKQAMDAWRKEKDAWDAGVKRFGQSREIGQHLVRAQDKMLRWSRLYRAIDACTPRQTLNREGKAVDAEGNLLEFRRRNEIFITSVTSHREDMGEWHARANSPQPAARDGAGGIGAQPGNPGGLGVGGPGVGGPGVGGPGVGGPGVGGPGVGGPGVGGPGVGGPGVGGPGSGGPGVGGPGTGPIAGPRGKGYVIRIEGYHFHNLGLNEGGAPADQGAEFLRQAFLQNLERPEMPIFGADGRPVLDNEQKPLTTPVKSHGIAYPTIVSLHLPDWNAKHPNPFFNPDVKDDKFNPKDVVRYDFVVEFAWLDEIPAEGATDAKGPSHVASSR